jgi:hypothetical protein
MTSVPSHYPWGHQAASIIITNRGEAKPGAASGFLGRLSLPIHHHIADPYCASRRALVPPPRLCCPKTSRIPNVQESVWMEILFLRLLCDGVAVVSRVRVNNTLSVCEAWIEQKRTARMVKL